MFVRTNRVYYLIFSVLALVLTQWGCSAYWRRTRNNPHIFNGLTGFVANAGDKRAKKGHRLFKGNC